jgi:uncharacterized protein YbjT (DUF2867 family)/uncharacterized protein YndB with AHSA1/START domain
MTERVFLTGATGYVGGRLASRLLDAGYSLRCLARQPRKLVTRVWAQDPRVEIVEGDLSDVDATAEVMRGCGPAFYLVHSMITAGSAYAARDRALATNFSHAAARAGVSRIVYLGGLGETGDDLSEHLASRREVGEILAAGRVPVTTLRAGMIIGSGSASFEILRYLVERLPVMVTPRWVYTDTQPIAIRNVLGYLVDCLATPETAGRTLDIGGPDVLRYIDLLQIMAEERGLVRRVVIPVPFFSPRLSSAWIHLVTPLGHRIAAPLAEGLRNRVVVRDDAAQRLIPQNLLTAREAIRLALGVMSTQRVETVWSASGAVPGDPDWAGGTLFVDRRSTEVAAPPEAVYQAIRKVGGSHGWYAANGLWRIRGFVDRLAGGPGLRRGRRDPDSLHYGEAVDFWRVTDVEPNRRLALRAEMRLPGEAQLEFTIEPAGDRTRLVQTARFAPKGLAGLLYWYSVLPLHNVVFPGMLDGIKRAAESAAVTAQGGAPQGVGSQ